MRTLVVVVLLALTSIASAKPLELETFDAGSFHLSMPKGWTFHAEANTALAQQDPKRKDAAQALVMVVLDTTTTEDQILDVLANKTVTNLKIVNRGPYSGGGKQLLAEGVTDGIKVRIGAIAIGNGQGMVIGLVVAKVGDFDALGGIGLVASMLGSIKASIATTTTTATTGPAHDAVMTPQYDSYHTLIIPPPARVLSLADLAGEWTNDSKALTNYYSTSTGAHVGYSAIVGNDTWVINATKGTIATKYHGANVSNTHVQAIDEKREGTIALSADGILSIVYKDFPKQTTLYMVRGWFVGADVTMLQINGPWYDSIPDNARPAGKNNYMNNVMVRAK